MTEPVEPKGSSPFLTTDWFLMAGFVFFVLGLTGDNNVAFLVLGAAMFAYGGVSRFRSGGGKG